MQEIQGARKEIENDLTYMKDYKEPKTAAQKSLELLTHYVKVMQEKKKDPRQKNVAYDSQIVPDQQIFDNDATKFSLGTVAYNLNEEHIQVQSTYVPIFPSFYKSQGFTSESTSRVKMFFQTSKKFQSARQEISYDNIYIRFTNEADSSTYQLDIMFDNVSKLYAREVSGGDKVQFLIYLRKPAKVFRSTVQMKKVYEKFAFKAVQSPFGFKAPDKGFMNYWNLKQVIFIEGRLDITMDLDFIYSKLQQLDLIPKIVISNLGNVRVLEEDTEECISYQDKLSEINARFHELLGQTVVPVRFGILALVSSYKFTVLDESILDLLGYILNMKFKEKFIFKSEKPQEDETGGNDEFLKEDSMIQEVQFVTYVLDEMSKSHVLRPKPNINIAVKGKKKKQRLGLLEAFKHNFQVSKIRDEIATEWNDKDCNQMRLRRIYQTPTLAIVAPSVREETHRVVRKYKKYKEFFFRITFVGENLDKTHYGNKGGKNVLDYVISILKDGIMIGNNRSEVVNYSNSQLKNHSVWMLVKTNIDFLTEQAIIESLGEFDPSQGMLKMFSRRGQCFSTTKLVAVLDEMQIEYLEKDITHIKEDDPFEEDKKAVYTFTDGCGNISRELCEMIDEKFNLFQCSAYQIRLGGAKGVLMYKPSLQGKLVQLRPSQIKFKCNEYYLEVIRCATFSQGYLNRQVILLMNCLGVPDEVFLELLNQAVENLDINQVMFGLRKLYNKSMKKAKGKQKAMNSQEFAKELELFFGPSKIFSPIFKYAATKTFESIDQMNNEKEEKKIEQEGKHDRVPDGGFDWDAEEVDQANLTYFKMEKEPIFETILNNMVLGQAVNLKKKARIKVKNSCVLIGTIDENGILEEGEVFVKICRSSFEKDEVIEDITRQNENYKTFLGANFKEETLSGYVIVTKNPCSHPGDIRLLKAVGKDDPRFEKLQDFCNIVVFPSKGKRPEQQKMSGGDLDGDVYMVIWEDSLVSCLSLDKLSSPACYKKYPEDSKAGDSNRIEDHIRRYFELDNLGHLSNLHLQLCDQIGIQGPFDKDAIAISRLISVAVDFAKHGKCVKEEDYQKFEKIITQQPDFMEGRSSKPVFESKLILGQIYRGVDCKSFFNKCVIIEHRNSILLQYRMNKYILKTEDKNRAQVIMFHNYLKDAYDQIVIPLTNDLIDIMLQFKIINEGELFCTSLTFNLDDEKHNKLIGDPGLKDEDAVKQLNQRIQELMAIYQLKFKQLRELKNCSAYHLARAVYFASYYNKGNDDFSDYASQFFMRNSDEEKAIIDFDTHWQDVQDEKGFDPEQWERLKDLSYYKKMLKKGKVASIDKISKILVHKQFFSIPWLVCYKELLF